MDFDKEVIGIEDVPPEIAQCVFNSIHNDVSDDAERVAQFEETSVVEISNRFVDYVRQDEDGTTTLDFETIGHDFVDMACGMWLNSVCHESASGGDGGKFSMDGGTLIKALGHAYACIGMGNEDYVSTMEAIEAVNGAIEIWKSSGDGPGKNPLVYFHRLMEFKQDIDDMDLPHLGGKNKDE